MKLENTTLTLGLSAILAGAAMAGPVAPVIEPETPKTFCDHYYDVLDLADLYEGDGPLIQEISLIGRYHGQYHDVESDLGDDSDWENRRFRFGLAAKFLNNFEFEGQFNIKRDFHSTGRLFDSVEDLVVTWEPNDFWSIAVGKQKPAITREYSTSSKRIKTVERSQFVNQVTGDKAGGVVVTFNDIGGNTIDLGAFSTSVDDDWELPDFEGGYALYGRVARDITDVTELRFDYQYEDGDAGDDQFGDYEHIFSLNSLSDWDRWHLVTDFIYAIGEEGTSDGYSVVLMPYFDLTDTLELVFRFTYSGSDEPDGLNVQSRYERAAAGRLNGDEYLSLYMGLNWYICGNP